MSQVWPPMKEAAPTETDQWARMCAIIECVTDYENWGGQTPAIVRTQSLIANDFVSDMVVRGILKARRRYQAKRDAESRGTRDEVEVGMGMDLDFDFGFAVWRGLEGSRICVRRGRASGE